MMKLTERYVSALKYLTTTAACLVFVAEGFVFTVPEPTLLQIRDVAGTSIAGISLVYCIRSVGGLVGSLITGFLMKNWKRDTMLGMITIIMSLALGIVPWCTNLPTMLGAFFVQGYGIGYIGTNVNVLIKDIWLEESAPALQALYFSFLIGSFLTPLLGAMFLRSAQPVSQNLPKYCSLIQNHHNFSIDAKMIELCGELVPEIQTTDVMDINSLKNFYVLVAVICTLFGIFMLVFGILNERYVLNGFSTADDARMPDKHQSKLVKISVLALITISGGLFIGAELNYAGFLATFVTVQLKGTSAQGIYITSMYWAIYMLAAAVGVVASKFIRAAKLMCFCCVIMTTGLVVLACSAQTTVGLWTGTAILALGCSYTYGGLFALADDYVALTPAVSAVVVSGTTVGELLVPLIGGQWFELLPMSLVYLTLSCIVVSDLGFIAMEMIMMTMGSRRKYLNLNETEKELEDEEQEPFLSINKEEDTIVDQILIFE